MNKVLLTRAESAAQRSAGKLRQLGFDPIVMPIFEVHDTGIDMPVDLADLFVFTSANAAETLDRRGWRPKDAEITAYCVGGRTAEAVAKLGFENVVISGPDAPALCRQLAVDHAGKELQALYPCGTRLQHDLAELLEPSDIAVTPVPVYRHQTIDRSKEEIAYALNALSGGSVMVYSAASARHLEHLLTEHRLEPLLKSLICICISKAAANPVCALPWRELKVVDQPNESSMLVLLQQAQ